jgi:hypothetical protein
MKTVTIKIGETDLRDLAEIFKNEAEFKPQAPQDHLIISILRQVLDNPKTELDNVIDIASS